MAGKNLGIFAPQLRYGAKPAIDWPLERMQSGDYFTVPAKARSLASVRNSVCSLASAMKASGYFVVTPDAKGNALVRRRTLVEMKVRAEDRETTKETRAADREGFKEREAARMAKYVAFHTARLAKSEQEKAVLALLD